MSSNPPTSIQVMAAEILRLLTKAREQGKGRGELDGSIITEITGLEPHDVNDAVTLLHNSGYVEWVQKSPMGSGLYFPPPLSRDNRRPNAVRLTVRKVRRVVSPQGQHKSSGSRIKAFAQRPFPLPSMARPLPGVAVQPQSRWRLSDQKQGHPEQFLSMRFALHL